MVQKNLSTMRERQLRKIDRDVPVVSPPVPIPMTSLVTTTSVSPSKSSTPDKRIPRAKADAKAISSKDSSKVGNKGTPTKDSSKVDGKRIPTEDLKIVESSGPMTLPSKSKSGGELFDGVVKMFLKDKGFGFISLSDATEVFFHVTVLVGDTIHVGDTVKCALAAGGSRKPRASEVHVAKRGALMRMICRNPICQSRRDRHFEDKCPNFQE